MHTRDLKVQLRIIGISRRSSRQLSVLRRGLVFLAAFSAALAVSVPAVAQDKGEGQEATLRVVHLSPDAPEVDVYVDGEPLGALSDVSFKTISSYLSLPAGTRNVKVYATGTSDLLLEADADLDGGSSYTLGVVGRLEDSSLAAKLYEDDNSPPSQGKAKVRVIHTVPDLGATTARVANGGDEDLFALPGFSNASNYTELSAGTYTLKVKGKARAAETDEVVLSVPDGIFSAGEVYTIFIMGRVADSSLGAGLTVDSRGGPPLLATGGPPAPVTESVQNSPDVTAPAVQEPPHEEDVVPTTLTTPELAYQEQAYQQLLCQEEPFAATPVEPDATFQQPTGGATVKEMYTTVPDTVGGATRLDVLSGDDATAVPDAVTDDATAQESLFDQESSQMTGSAYFASASNLSGQSGTNEGAARGKAVAGVGATTSMPTSVQALA